MNSPRKKTNFFYISSFSSQRKRKADGRQSDRHQSANWRTANKATQSFSEKLKDPCDIFSLTATSSRENSTPENFFLFADKLYLQRQIRLRSKSSRSKIRSFKFHLVKKDWPDKKFYPLKTDKIKLLLKTLNPSHS